MTVLPSLISNYLDDYNGKLYEKMVDYHKLSYLCLVKLLKLHLPVKKDFTIEELIDYHDGGIISLSYPLVTQLANQLNILHLTEIVEPMTLIFDQQLKNYIHHCINILKESNIMATCFWCDKLLLL